MPGNAYRKRDLKTEIARTGTPNERSESVARAVALLRAGEVVALPTETVYGLAADALSAQAVVKIFETKERPHFDPLIVHLAGKRLAGARRHHRGGNARFDRRV